MVIFKEGAEQWGASAYDEDALRVAIAPRPLDPPVEVFDIVGTKQGFALRWADVESPVRVQRDTSSPTARPAFGEP